MHHIYTSPCIILSREPQDTSASYLILTRDMGVIRAHAQGVRKAQARLKGALQEYSSATVAFVQGKAGWKITTAIPERNFWNDADGMADATEVKKILTRISGVLVRLIAGEEKNTNIYTAVQNGFSVLVTDGSDSHTIESVILARVLYSLGYIAMPDLSMLFTDFSDFGPDVLAYAHVHKAPIITAINKGFKESQM